MQEHKVPRFSKGRVLKQESLEALRDLPGAYLRLEKSGWADGILWGFPISCREGCLCVGAGAVLKEGEIFRSRAESLPFSEYGRPVTVRLWLGEKQETEDFEICPLEIRAAPGEPAAAEKELGRFCLEEGAELRTEYRDLGDFRTAYNTLDITQAPYAGPGGVTVSPVLLRAFGRALWEQAGADAADRSFALLCLNQASVSRECLLRYLSGRLGESFRELSHAEIYERLVRAAGKAPAGSGPGRRREGPAVSW